MSSRSNKLMVKDIVEMSYVQAFLELTVEQQLPCKAALDWIHFLADKFPQSRLAVHVKMAMMQERNVADLLH